MPQEAAVALDGTSAGFQIPLEASRSIGRRIAAFIDDDATVGILRSGLAVLGDDLEIHSGTIRAAIRYLEMDIPAQALIVDVSGIEDPQGALDHLARVCPADVRVFVIGESTDIGCHRMLLGGVGIAGYLPKPVSRDALLRLLPKLVGDTAADQGQARAGHLVCVCGAGAGVGASSIALNLAFELLGAVKGQVGLLDLHLQGGALALMLSARPGPGLRIALEHADRVDSLFLERASIELHPRLRLIASEDVFNHQAPITESGVVRVLDALRQACDYIVADVPMPLPPQMTRALAMASQVVTVLTPDVASLRDTPDIRRLVTRMTGADRVISVLNRADLKGGVGLALVEQAIDGPPDVMIPDLGAKMRQSVNLGVPAVHRIPALRRHLAPLVHQIAGVPADPTPRTWLRRMFTR
jgi:pilus assembly protein CpaE